MTDKLVTLAYHKTKLMLAAGTRQGRLLVWKQVSVRAWPLFCSGPYLLPIPPTHTTDPYHRPIPPDPSHLASHRSSRPTHTTYRCHLPSRPAHHPYHPTTHTAYPYHPFIPPTRTTQLITTSHTTDRQAVGAPADAAEKSWIALPPVVFEHQAEHLSWGSREGMLAVASKGGLQEAPQPPLSLRLRPPATASSLVGYEWLHSAGRAVTYG